MPTNLALDDRLIEQVKKLGGYGTKREAVNAALAEFIAKRKQKKILDLFGQVDWDSTYDYKAERRKR